MEIASKLADGKFNLANASKRFDRVGSGWLHAAIKGAKDVGKLAPGAK